MRGRGWRRPHECGHYKQQTVRTNAARSDRIYAVWEADVCSDRIYAVWEASIYDYRRMSPADRQAIVAYRRERGFPLHKPPHLHLGLGWYFITAATFEHRPHFAEPRELTALERRLLEAFQAAKLPCAGWVILPNHYHALVHSTQVASIGRALGPVHGRSGKYANERDRAPGRQVWYKFSDRKVRSERHFWACLHYILHNPVKHGYVDEMAEWSWSCYKDVLEQNGQEWMDQLIKEYPLGDFGSEWDA